MLDLGQWLRGTEEEDEVASEFAAGGGLQASPVNSPTPRARAYATAHRSSVLLLRVVYTVCVGELTAPEDSDWDTDTEVLR